MMNNSPSNSNKNSNLNSNSKLDKETDKEISVKYLVKFLTKLGHISIYVYNKKAPVREYVDDYIRNKTVKMSVEECTEFSKDMAYLGKSLSQLKKKIKITKHDIDRLKGTGSRIPIGTLVTGYDLLKISLMSSDNRAASALSRAYPSGKKGFIKAMNIKALKLGMHNSKFADPTGLNKRNKSTARDLVRMVEAAYQYPEIRKITTTSQETFRIGKRKNEIGFVNTNRLVRKGTWDIGLSKTGFTRDAGRCLVMQAVISNEPVIMIFLNSYGTLTRFADAQRVKKWIKKESIMNKISQISAN